MRITALIAWASLVLASCTSKDDEEVDTPNQPTENHYITTSSTGDLASWTFDGNAFAIDWKVTDTIGDIARTLTVSGDCGAPDATYAFRTCTVGEITCSPTACGGTDPVVGDLFYTLEVPGVALLVARQDDDEVHAGFVNGGCDNSGLAGDYLFTTLHPGDSSIFGMYRLGPTTMGPTFPQSLTHADFGFNSSNPQNDQLMEDVSLAYSDPNGATTLDDITCANGVRTVSAGGGSIRVNVTASGLFVVDKPSGGGGLISFRTDKAATLSDLANKAYVGLLFPDDEQPARVARAVLGPTAGTPAGVEVTSLQYLGNDTPVQPMQTIYPASAADGSIASLPNLTATPQSNNGQSWNTNPLASAFATAANIPGIFMVTPVPGDRGRVVLAATKSGGKTLLFGAVYNVRYINSGYRFVNSGSFLFFEQ